MRSDTTTRRSDTPPVDAHAGQAPLVTQRLSDRLAQLLQHDILDGRYAPGARIPTEAQLALRHGVSRSVVREAVGQLKSRGLVHARQGSGVYVNASPTSPLLFDARVLESMQSVLDVVELRRVLESEIAGLAAERATRAQVAEVRRRLRAIDEAMAAGRDGAAEDLAFHRAIAEATGNPQFPRLLGFLEQYLLEAIRVTKGNESRNPAFMQAVRREHHDIAQAITSHDVRAARKAALTHMVNGERRLAAAGVIDAKARRGAATRGPRRIEPARP
jgi:GntR family transcriptional regulator, transcriptional repressor for pyruvate dehydrogenase complex